MYCKAKKNFGAIRNFLNFFIFENLLHKKGLKGGISIDADSGPPRYVLWCCDSIFHDVFISIKIGLEICLCGNPKKLLGGWNPGLTPHLRLTYVTRWKLVCVFFEECHRRLRRVNKPFPIVHLVHVRQTQARNPEPWQSLYVLGMNARCPLVQRLFEYVPNWQLPIE